MSSHYCIGNPCWICNPNLAPKTDDVNFDMWQLYMEDHKKPDNYISGILLELLIDVFKSGLDEDQHYRSMPDWMVVDDLIEERKKVLDTSLEAKLIDLIIKDIDSKNEDPTV